MTDELKPCCCGMGDQFVAECKAYGSGLLLKYVISCGDCGRSVESDEYEECVRHWNTRPIEDALVKALEVARRELIECYAEIESIEPVEIERASGNDETLRIIETALALANGGNNE